MYGYVIHRLGAPKRLISDQGKEFCNKVSYVCMQQVYSPKWFYFVIVYSGFPKYTADVMLPHVMYSKSAYLK